MDRRRKIEEKKRRLAELRRRKDERRKQKEEAAASANNGNTEHEGEDISKKKNLRRAEAAPSVDLDNLIEGLLNSAPPGSTATDNSNSIEKPPGKNETSTSPKDSPSNLESAADASSKAATSTKEKLKMLTLVNSVAKINIVRSKAETYERGTQTDAYLAADQTKSSESVPTITTPAVTTPYSVSAGSTAETLPEIDPQSEENESSKDEETKTHILTKAEAKERMSTDGFRNFLERSTGFIERALDWNEDFNFTIEYGHVEEDAKEERTVEALSKRSEYSDKRWTAGRTVTDVNWSPHYKELFLAAYNERDLRSRDTTDPDGVLLVWSLHRHTTPEFVFTSQSSIMTADFHTFAPNLLVGGTFSGQVCIFDKRAKSQAVQRTLISEEGHAHPIRALSIVGTSNANDLVTVSSDGKLCKWDMTQLRRPTYSAQLQYAKRSKMKEDIPVMSLANVHGDLNTVYVGSESGHIYRTYTDERHDAKDGIVQYPSSSVGNARSKRSASSKVQEGGSVLRQVDGHFGPVTSVDFHSGAGGLSRSYDSSHLLLSASIDWTCKLWDLKRSTSPICEFQCVNDYVLDVRWSPTHPAVFAASDAVGSLQLWNLNAKHETPILRTNPSGAASKSAARALNCARWSTTGGKIATGDSTGVVSLYDVHSDIVSPRSDAAARFSSLLARIAKTNSGDGEV
eukprot:g1459.t1